MAKVSLEQLDRSTEGGFAPLAPGAYDAVIVGVIDSIDEFEGKKRNVTKFLYQIIDEGKPQIMRSAGLVPSLHEKSGFFLLLSGWLKSKDANKIKEALTKAGIIANGELDFDKFLGRRLGVLVSNAVSAKGKEYAKAAGCMPCKTKDLQVAPQEIPGFYLDGATHYVLQPGVTIKKADIAAQANDTAAAVDVGAIIEDL